MSLSVLGDGFSILALKTGLSAANAEILSDKLNKLNKNSKPEDVVKVVREINEFLISSGLEGSKVLKVIESVTKPLNDAAQAALKMKENVAASSQAASELAANLLKTQNKFFPQISEARRIFDQIGAVELEAAMKREEFEKSVRSRRSKGEIVTAQEVAEKQKQIDQERVQKTKDIQNAQKESAYGQQLALETRSELLLVDSRILDLQIRQINGLDYKLLLEESILKNIYDQQQANAAIEELYRKGNITRERANDLENMISENRKRADENSEKALQKRIADTQKQLSLELSTNILQQLAAQKMFELEKNSVFLSSTKIDSLKQQYQLEAKRNDEVEKLSKNSSLSDDEKAQKLFLINDQFNEQLRIIKETEKFRNEQQKSFGEGSTQRLKEIEESFSNFKVAGMAVDSVWNNMGSAIDKFVETGKISFSDFARSVIMDLEKIAIKSAVVGVFKSIGLGDIFSLPGRAGGGPVSGGQAYMVGENGPELFIPQTSGTIKPNGSLGRGGNTTVINNHISAIDAKSVAQLFSDNRMTLFGTVEQARRELPMRTR
jgi:lambda family phage tail tape measure protein